MFQPKCYYLLSFIQLTKYLRAWVNFSTDLYDTSNAMLYGANESKQNTKANEMRVLSISTNTKPNQETSQRTEMKTFYCSSAQAHAKQTN